VALYAVFPLVFTNILRLFIFTLTYIYLLTVDKLLLKNLYYTMSQIFREQDGVRSVQQMHPSFRAKPLVDDQFVAAVSHMDYQSGVKLATINDNAPKPVPTTYDTVYDPNDPRADWTGAVKINERAHYRGHRSMEGHIDQKADGFIATEEQPMWTCKRRGQNQRGPTDSTPGLIGGIGDDPKSHYRSVAQRQANLESTNEDQYTLAKRSLNAGRRNIMNPSQSKRVDSAIGPRVHFGENSVNDEAMTAEEEAQYMEYMQAEAEKRAQAQYHQQQQQQPVQQKSLLGFRGPAQTMSLTSNLADSIASKISIPAPSMTSTNFRKDQQKDATSAIPGYTGYRPGENNIW